jgi:hypothetical protein
MAIATQPAAAKSAQIPRQSGHESGRSFTLGPGPLSTTSSRDVAWPVSALDVAVFRTARDIAELRTSGLINFFDTAVTRGFNGSRRLAFRARTVSLAARSRLTP